MRELQDAVRAFVVRYNMKTSPEIRFIDLVSEVGELGKELLKGSGYGKTKFVALESLDVIKDEFGDVIFSLLCLADICGVSLEDSLTAAMAKYERRIAGRGTAGSEP